MDTSLKELYRELLSTKMKDEKTIYERIAPGDLCLAGHRVGRLYDGLLIYGQAMNGWQNGENLGIDDLINEIEVGSKNYKELYTMVDYNGWHGYTNVNFGSQRDNRLGRENAYKTSETLCFWGFSLPSNLYGISRNVVEICGYVASMQHVCIKNHSNYVVRFKVNR